MSPSVLRIAHALARDAVLTAEQLKAPAIMAELGERQVSLLRGLLSTQTTFAEMLAGRRPLPTLLDVLPQGEQELQEQLARVEPLLNGHAPELARFRETEGLAGGHAGALILPTEGAAASVEPAAPAEISASTSRVPPAGGGRPEDDGPTAAHSHALGEP